MHNCMAVEWNAFGEVYRVLYLGAVFVGCVDMKESVITSAPVFLAVRTAVSTCWSVVSYCNSAG
jgi:hypothetical protein